MGKIKVIQLAHASHAVWADSQKSLQDMIAGDWFSLTAKQIKRFYPEIEVECWCPEKIKKAEEFEKFDIRYRQFPTTFAPMYGLDFSIPMLRELRKEVKKSKKEGYKLIIHLHEYHNLHGLLIATLFKNQNLIAQHHGGSWPMKLVGEIEEYKRFFLAFWLGQLWENKVLKNIKIFYPLSAHEIEYLKKRAPNSKIKFQTMGIDDFYFDSIPKNEARKKVGWPLKKKILLYLGRINKFKGIPYLLKAMKDIPEVELKIIGWGEQEKFEKEARENGLNNVEFLGPIFERAKLPYLSAADAFILPSAGKEGASVTTMEAMARNLPIVSTDVAGMPLVIENNKQGYLIKRADSKEMAEAIKKIMKWKNKNIKRYAEKYRWKGIIKDTVKDYERI